MAFSHSRYRMRDLDAKVILNTNYIKGSSGICLKFILKFAGLR